MDRYTGNEAEPFPDWLIRITRPGIDLDPALEENRTPREGVRVLGMAEELLAIGARYADLPSYDKRTNDEILGYDEHGSPS